MATAVGLSLIDDTAGSKKYGAILSSAQGIALEYRIEEDCEALTSRTKVHQLKVTLFDMAGEVEKEAHGIIAG